MTQKSVQILLYSLQLVEVKTIVERLVIQAAYTDNLSEHFIRHIHSWT